MLISLLGWSFFTLLFLQSYSLIVFNNATVWEVTMMGYMIKDDYRPCDTNPYNYTLLGVGQKANVMGKNVTSQVCLTYSPIGIVWGAFEQYFIVKNQEISLQAKIVSHQLEYWYDAKKSCV